MAVAQAATIRLALHVLQLHRQDMHLLTLVAAVVQVATILQAILAWHPQIARAMLSFLAVEVVLVATIHQARVVRLTDLMQLKLDQ